jgi:hypothetical protein
MADTPRTDALQDHDKGLLRAALEKIADYGCDLAAEFDGPCASKIVAIAQEAIRAEASQPASQPDSVVVPVDVKTILVVMKVLTFLKGVLIGLGFKSDSSSINQLEIAYSMLRAAKEPTK